MEELKKLLLQTDDEYLTGLCNKGTVKRAYKDLGEENPSVQWQEEGVEVKLKETICQIRVPLGESSCSCPSRSICRHLITAILYVKQKLDGEEKVGLEEGTKSGQAESVCECMDSPEQKEQREGIAGQYPESDRQSKMYQEAESGDQSAASRELKSNSQSAANGEQNASSEPVGSQKQRSSDSHTGTGETKASSIPLLQELSSLSLTDLKRACKGKAYQSLVTYIRAGRLPDIQLGTVITVRFPWEAAVVKLLSPLEYSSCSCHSKKLCTHKAQAILAVGLSQGIWDVEKLEQMLEEKMVWDNQVLQQTAASIKEVICLQLMTGLSRLSPEAEESMERLAVISHSAQLPAFETGFRAAAAEYRMYFERKSAFRVEKLIERLLKLYHRTVLLERAREPERLRSLAGSFRDVYHPMPRLHLAAIGARSIQSKTGYEGESYYFLEINQGRWYTWTDVRPVFYEGVRRRPTGKLGQTAAPWGLGCSREQLMEMEFFLDQGKATEDGRLSVSQDTKGELVGVRNLRKEELSRMIFWDYRQLLRDCFQKQDSNTERLALVGAKCVQEASFDQIEQRFTMKLLDWAGRCIRVAVKYSQEEKLTIRVLERLSQRLEGQKQVRMVFFGIPYLEQGELYLYPIEFFGGKDILEPEEGDIREEGTEAENCPEPQMLKRMEAFCTEIRQVSSAIFQCGLNSLQEGNLRELQRLAQESEEQGLHRLGQELAFLAKELGEKRHRITFEPEPVLASWVRLEACLRLCLEKLTLDSAWAGMEEAEAIQ